MIKTPLSFERIFNFSQCCVAAVLVPACLLANLGWTWTCYRYNPLDTKGLDSSDSWTSAQISSWRENPNTRTNLEQTAGKEESWCVSRAQTHRPQRDLSSDFQSRWWKSCGGTGRTFLLRKCSQTINEVKHRKNKWIKVLSAVRVWYTRGQKLLVPLS